MASTWPPKRLNEPESLCFDAGAGIAWMFGLEVGQGGSLLGMLVASAVPLAGAVNWTVLQRVGEAGEEAPDMLPAVLIGALLSALFSLPLAWPLQASGHDLGLLALLGSVQLAIPCLLVVRLTRVLPGPEIALLALLEVVFGVAWAWLWAGEVPAVSVLVGGCLVLGALVVNEGLLGLCTPGPEPITKPPWAAVAAGSGALVGGSDAIQIVATHARQTGARCHFFILFPLADTACNMVRPNATAKVPVAVAVLDMFASGW